MAAWPANGETDWNTKMLAYLAVGHETDGTHNQQDWTPSTYAGGKTMTLPNGLIVNWGSATVTAGAITVTYSTAFAVAAAECILLTGFKDDTGGNTIGRVRTTTTAGFTAYIDTAMSTCYWLAIGY